MPSVNHFRVKREAHALSRQSSGARFNPFAPFNWKLDKRSNTFPSDLEQGYGQGNGRARNNDETDEVVSPIVHASTAPVAATGGPGFSRSDHEEKNGLHESDSGRNKEEVEGDGEELEGGDYASPLSEQMKPANASRNPPRINTAVHDGLRNRRAESSSQATTAITGDEAGPTPAGEESKEEGEQEKDKKNKKKDSRFLKHIEPKEPFTVANQLQRTFLNSWINILLLAVPAGIALHFTSVTPIAVFVVNFIAIIPLAAMLSFATEEIALRTGETLGGLLNATFGNAVELIVAVVALLNGQVVIVQTSLIGSILSNLLLVLGMCFFFGGLRRQEQFFNTTVAQTAASLLALAVAGVIVPTVFDKASSAPDLDVAMLSRGTSIILLVVYAGYLFFQLHTHHTVFSEESQKVPAKPFRNPYSSSHRHDHRHRDDHPGESSHGGGDYKPAKDGISRGLASPARGLVATGMSPTTRSDKALLSRMLMTPPRAATAEESAEARKGDGDGDGEEEGEEPQLHFLVALAVLAGSTVVIAFCAEFLVDSIDYVTTSGGISKEFLGLILLPIVGNAAEHATAVTVAIKDKMDLAIGVAIGSSMQVALFLIPLLVIIGWGRGMEDMSLSFDVFQVAVLFVSVLLVNYLIGDGKSHWLEGMLLICLYCIIAVCSWWYPVNEIGQSSRTNNQTLARL